MKALETNFAWQACQGPGRMEGNQSFRAGDALGGQGSQVLTLPEAINPRSSRPWVIKNWNMVGKEQGSRHG
eukprot:1160702-Pelagomonas_calceolata.AAC.8